MLQISKKYNVPYLYIGVALCCVCLGRAYQCLFWDVPIRALLWNEEFMAAPIAFLLKVTWSEYLLHPDINSITQGIISSIGIGLLVGCFTLVYTNHQRMRCMSSYFLLSLLVFIAFLYHLKKFHTAGQFFEYTLQFMTPIIFWKILQRGATSRWIILVKTSIALTFISHGLYALGFYPIPGNFVAMTINILNCSDAFAIQFLMLVGFLDLLCSIGLFFGRRVFQVSILYCIIWGCLTAFARIVANVDFEAFGSTMHQWAYQTLYRAPHFLIPIALYVTINLKADTSITLEKKK